MRLSAFACLLLILLLASPLPGQNQANLAILAGANLSKVDYNAGGAFNTTSENKIRAGYGLGLTLALPVSYNSALSVVTGAMLQSRGGKTAFSGPLTDETSPDPIGTQTSTSDFKLTYVAVPVAIRFFLGQGKQKPFFQVGSELAIRVAASLDGGDIKKDIQSMDIAVMLGGGAELPMGSRKVLLQLIYTHGLTDVLDAKDAAFNVKLKNRVLSLMAGIAL